LIAGQACSRAVVIVTPSRRLRDSILQAPYFLGSIFENTGYGSRVSWLGRPSDGPGSFCSWEEKVAELVNKRLKAKRDNVKQVETHHLIPQYERMMGGDIQWGRLRYVLPQEEFDVIEAFRKLSSSYMGLIVDIKRQRAVEWEKIIQENTESLLVLSTMDVFIKWRAGEIKGYVNRLLRRFEISLFCMEEFESFDLPQVVAALANIPVRTLLMVGDKHQRIDNSRRGGRRAHFVTEAGFDATRLDAGGDADDDPASSHLSAAQCSNGELHSTSCTVPESRPWYEWSTHAEPFVLDLCK